MCNGRVYIKTEAALRTTYAPIQFGVFILAHSRELMQDYFEIIGKDNVIASETDSIYSRKSALHNLLVSTHPLYRIGKELGNMDLEENNIIDSYFLGKKCYALKIQGKDKDGKVTVKTKFRLKGVPSNFLRWEAYERLHRDCQVTFPLVNEATGKPFDIVDKNGFTEDPAMILWNRVLFNGHTSGVSMKKMTKTVVCREALKDYDYTKIGCRASGVEGIQVPNCPRKALEKVLPRFISEDVYRAKRPKISTAQEANIQLGQIEYLNHAELQASLLASFIAP